LEIYAIDMADSSDLDVSLAEDENSLGGDQLPQAEASKQDRPSEYLRARCPACFGGQRCHDPNEM